MQSCTKCHLLSGKKSDPHKLKAKFVPFIKALAANWFPQLRSTYPLQSFILYFIGKFKPL